MDYDARGVKLREYAGNHEQLLKWPEVEKRIHVLIAAGQYLDEPEQTVPDEKDTRTEGEILREKLAARGIVNGHAVDSETLDNDPFIQQVEADVKAAGTREIKPEETHPARDPLTPAYQKGDTVYLEGSPYEITGVSTYHVELLPPGQTYPVFRSEPKERFEHLLAQDERNAHIADYLPEPPEMVNADLREALTGEGGLLNEARSEALAAAFCTGESNRAIAERLSEICDGETGVTEFWSGDFADYYASRAGLEVVIHDKYETTISRNWGEVARTLRTLYQLGQGEFARESKAVEQLEPVAEATEPEPPEPERPPAQNFRITDEHLGEGGPKQKYARNIEAIRTLQAIEAEGRSATPEEQAVLSQYVGWGGLADAFDPEKDSWAKEYKELKSLLPEDEYAAARASTLNAHYTSPTVIRAIYDTVEQMGFRTGNILEPSCGVGNFFGMLPESMKGSRLYGVELDSITGRIARQLYPQANITVAGFETTSQRDFYDLAVGNVPFGNYRVNDKAYNQLGFSIHNYFFAKALDQVRHGGIVAFITSRFTMDSKDSSARKYLAQRADLLGAVRLPNNAFKANAGTEVVSDILFLQKLERPIDREPEWVQVGQTPEGFTVNQYFVDHPDMVLGELSAESTQYGREDVTVAVWPGGRDGRSRRGGRPGRTA